MTETEAATGSIAVGAIVRSAREHAGMTQDDLAAKVGVTQTAVSYWEAGKRDIGVADLLRIADAIGVSASSLLPIPHRGEPEPAPLPAGQFARVELPGFVDHTGWLTKEAQEGVLTFVIRDWDGNVTAEVSPNAYRRIVYLPTPMKRPDPQIALTSGEYDEPWSSESPDLGPF